MINNWKKLGTRDCFKNRIVHVKEKDFWSEQEKDQMAFTVVEMSNWATIVPVTANNEFIIVKQFRAGPEIDTLEFPGGGVNKDEDPRIAAERELVEETGATADEFVLLSAMDPNPAFMTNKCHVFLAKNAKITKTPKRDKFEDTEAFIVPYEKLIDMIKKGEFRQSISLAALGLYFSNLNSSK